MTETTTTAAETAASPNAAEAIAYFSMEIGLRADIPTYSGGLGILAGDTLRAAADLGMPICAVTLLYHHGYFRQKLDAQGNQTEEPISWAPEKLIEPLPARRCRLRGARQVRAWRPHRHLRRSGMCSSSTPTCRRTTLRSHPTDNLYGGDRRYALPGGGARDGGVEPFMPGDDRTDLPHERGHSALLCAGAVTTSATALPTAITAVDVERVRQRCVFTTHARPAATTVRLAAGRAGARAPARGHFSPRSTAAMVNSI